VNKLTEPQPHHIVIIGGGAGGLELATKLGDTLGKRGLARVTLIDANMTHLWKPLLHEVAAGTLNSYADELNYLAQAHWHHFHFWLGRVDTIDRGRKEVSTEPRFDENGDEYIPRRTLTYDTLIIAVGSISNDFGIPGVKEYCHFIDHRKEADQFHQHLLRSCFTAQAQKENIQEGQLNIAIAGAGATGVELAAELHTSTRELVEYGLDRITPEKDIKIAIIEANQRILPGLPEHLSAEITQQLRDIGIDILTGERITEATADGFRTQSGKFIRAAIKVWAAGIKAPDFLAHIDGLEVNGSNQLVVETTLQTTRDENIFAFGDCAACPMTDGSGNVPPRAQAAHQQASLLLKTMRCRLAGKSLPRYRYVDYGSLINMSRYTTVGNLMGSVARLWSTNVFVEGYFARLVYQSLYKMHQLALHGFIRVAANTLANLLTRRGKPRMKLH
jgi:NADH dehydrogenase